MIADLRHAVSRRIAKFGVRLAPGASPADLHRLVLTHGARLLGLGLLIALAASLAVSRIGESLLFGIAARGVTISAAVTALLATVGLIVCILPARRAANTDPMFALRAE